MQSFAISPFPNGTSNTLSARLLSAALISFNLICGPSFTETNLLLTNPDRTGDFDIKMIEGLMKKWQEPFATLSPNTLTFNNFTGYYTQFTGSIAGKGSEYRTLADNQKAMAGSIQDKRSGITGVSSDEELTYLIKFQQAYNASARYINVIDEMLEHVIERLG